MIARQIFVILLTATLCGCTHYVRVDGSAVSEAALQRDQALCDGRLFWSQARLLARIATPQTEAAWLQWAARRTIRQIEAQIRNRNKGQLPTDPAKRRIHSTAYKVEGPVGQDVGHFSRLRLELLPVACELEQRGNDLPRPQRPVLGSQRRQLPQL